LARDAGGMDLRLSALSRRQLFGAAVAVAVVIVLALRHLGGGGAPAAAPTYAPAPARAAKPAAAKLLVVDVAGEVRRPGLHSLPAGYWFDLRARKLLAADDALAAEREASE